MTELLNLNPNDFIAFLKQENLRRAYFIYDAASGRVRTSHERLDPIARFLENDQRDFMAHEGIFLQLMPEYDFLMSAFVHNTTRGQGAGGTRFWHYANMEDFFRDGLRLSRGMTHKNALAGLWWGGGKGVIARNPRVDARDPSVREALFRAYGRFITSLSGCYVTAEDVGTTPVDIANIFKTTRFTTCIPPELGGSGNPSVPTATGVLRGMEAALRFSDEGTLRGRTILVQGLGHVGAPLVKMLFESGVRKVIAVDISPDRVADVQRQCIGYDLDAKTVGSDDMSFLSEQCDVFAPCATGAILNPRTIPQLKARIVCGAANNQLEDPTWDDLKLFERGILYVPDFLVNRMGIVNCANEQYGIIPNDPYIRQHLNADWEYSVYQVTLKVLQASAERCKPPAHTAMQIAEDLAREAHPIFGHRGKAIIQGLTESHWHVQR